MKLTARQILGRMWGGRTTAYLRKHGPGCGHVEGLPRFVCTRCKIMRVVTA